MARAKRSRSERPYYMLNEDEKTRLRHQQEKAALKQHQLVRVGKAAFGCVCGMFYQPALSQRDAEASHGNHLSCVQIHLTERANNVPDWS